LLNKGGYWVITVATGAAAIATAINDNIFHFMGWLSIFYLEVP
jgi:hypothetical protein